MEPRPLSVLIRQFTVADAQLTLPELAILCALGPGGMREGAFLRMMRGIESATIALRLELGTPPEVTRPLIAHDCMTWYTVARYVGLRIKDSSRGKLLPAFQGSVLTGQVDIWLRAVQEQDREYERIALEN